MAEKKKVSGATSRPCDLGVGAARKAAEALAGRRKTIAEATKDGTKGKTPAKRTTPKPLTPKKDQAGATKDYQMKKAREDMLKAKAKKK